MSRTTPSLRILGSGSSGNLAILDLPDPAGGDEPPRHLLIDLGLGPRTTRTRLTRHGGELVPEKVIGVLATHADQDHLRPSWAHTITCHRWPVFASPSHHPGLARLGVPAARLHAVPDLGRSVEIVPGVAVSAAIAPHDDHGTSAYRIRITSPDGTSVSLGWATDLGRFTPPVERLLEDCDALAMESNYDPGLQSRSTRPPFLKRRITGGHGHLSNEEALEAVLRLALRREPSLIALIHLSRDCNHPDMVQRLWEDRAPDLAARVHLADATVPSPALPLKPGNDPSQKAPTDPFTESLFA
ncbi:MAG: hypothetical protein CMJ34_15080 [Phycisphaerae bacterium]|nr:hypothetical protein [Phycisphaerae bacterium]